MNINFREPTKAAAKIRLSQELVKELKKAPVHRFDLKTIQTCVSAYIELLPEVPGRDIMVAISSQKKGRINDQQGDYLEDISFGTTVRLMPPNG